MLIDHQNMEQSDILERGKQQMDKTNWIKSETMEGGGYNRLR